MMIIILSLFFSVFSSAAPVTPYHLMDIWYQWQAPMSDVSFTLTIESDPGIGSAYYWSHYFVFSNSPEKDDDDALRAGYMGLQTDLDEKRVIFSVWNALEADGKGCQTFDGEGIGYKCLFKYNFVEKVPYKFTVRSLESDVTGDWWEGIVKNMKTGRETIIGRIKSPPKSGEIKESVFFDEHYEEISSCAALRYAKVRFADLRGNSGQGIPSFLRYVEPSPCPKDIKSKIDGLDIEVETGGNLKGP